LLIENRYSSPAEAKVFIQQSSIILFASIRYIDQGMKVRSNVVVRPARNIRGNVELPGDKSISHRYGMLAGIAEGPSRIENYSTGADCASTLGCMRAMGVKWERNSTGQNVVEVQGRGFSLAAPATPLDCGNSGSTMRMLSGIVAGQSFTSEMIGEAALSHGSPDRVAEGQAALADYWRPFEID
jgi:3-phosphoshikimate 1-carboxyvinyltransferase